MSFIMSKKQNKTDKAFKAVLLDADGTLYDSTMLHFEAYKQVCLELYTFDFTEEIYFAECVRKYKKPPQILQERGIECNAEEFYLKKREYYFEIAKKKLRPMYGLKIFLRNLKKSHIPCAVVSGASLNSLIDSINLLGLDGFFHFIISHEDIGAKQKPDPYPFLIASKKLGIFHRHCLAFEDTESGIRSAKGAGMYCIAIRNSTNSRDELGEADLVVEDYSKLKYRVLDNQIVLL